MKSFPLLLLGLYFSFLGFGQVQPGLDSSFGKKGMLIDTAYNFFSIDDMTLLPDGRLLTVGNYVAQYLSDGRRDISFGKAGKFALDSAAKPKTLHGSSINLLSNGKIIVSGDTYFSNAHSNFLGGFVIRLNNNGSLDSSFGKNGVTLLDAVVQKSTIQSDGKIVTAGPISLSDYVFVNRLTENGIVDSSFGINGWVKIWKLVNEPEILGLGILSDGRIGVVSSDHYNVIDCRIFSNGQPDSSIGPRGFSYRVNAFYCHTAKVNSDGSVVASIGGLNSSNDAALAYIKTDGKLDSSIAVNGLLGVPGLLIKKLVLMTDGRLICGGYNDSSFAVARVLNNGTGIDFSFGQNGIITTKVAEWMDDRIHAMALQSDGKIVAAGESRKSNIVVPRASIVRYLPDAPAPPLAILPIRTIPSKLLIYPNPSNSEVIISSTEKGILEIFSTDGKLMRRQYCRNNITVIDVSLLPKGSYILSLKTTSTTQNCTFSKL